MMGFGELRLNLVSTRNHLVLLPDKLFGEFGFSHPHNVGCAKTSSAILCISMKKQIHSSQFSSEGRQLRKIEH